MQLYVGQQGQQKGPFPLPTVKEMLQRGELSSTDLVWHEGAPAWMPLSSFMAVNDASSSSPAAVRTPAPAAPAPAHHANHAAVTRALAGVKGLHGITFPELQAEIQRGAVFVRYQYCISIIVMTFKRSSPIYFVRGGHSRVGPGVGYSFISIFLGWWGIPWGPIWTITTLVNNFNGGKDLTAAVMSALANQPR